MRRKRSPCWARAANGIAAAPNKPMNSRRLIASPEAQGQGIAPDQTTILERGLWPIVRFGSKADICSAKEHVRFTPECGHLRLPLECPLCANSGHRVGSRLRCPYAYVTGVEITDDTARWRIVDQSFFQCFDIDFGLRGCATCHDCRYLRADDRG